MNLVFDIGNTRVKSGLFDGKNLLNHDVFPFEIGDITRKIKLHEGPILISSVIELNEDLMSQTEKNIIFLSENTALPIKNGYKTPETLGKDRLANAVAINATAHSEKALSIDCGTCLKFDLVVKGEYLGGSISPGLRMRFNSLHTFTDKLPLIEPEQFVRLNGKDTKESILSGCYRGMLAEIKHTINDYETEFGELEIFLTGGDHLFFANHLKNRIFADPFLTLRGLNEILLFKNT